jgi:hypothetical protein
MRTFVLIVSGLLLRWGRLAPHRRGHRHDDGRGGSPTGSAPAGAGGPAGSADDNTLSYHGPNPRSDGRRRVRIHEVARVPGGIIFAGNERHDVHRHRLVDGRPGDQLLSGAYYVNVHTGANGRARSAARSR